MNYRMPNPEDSPVFNTDLGVISFKTSDGHVAIDNALSDLAMSMDYVAFLREEAEDATMLAPYQSALLRTWGRSVSAIRRDVARLAEMHCPQQFAGSVKS